MVPPVILYYKARMFIFYIIRLLSLEFDDTFLLDNLIFSTIQNKIGLSVLFRKT